MKASLENLLRNQSLESAERIKLIAMLGTVYFHLGMVSIDTEELSNGENFLQKCEDVIQDYIDSPVMIMVMEWPTRECGNTASVLACNLRPPC
ncbi:hypothetical protein MTP99_012287 [Tenebrio molitor]|nr:hypothetical protein MTP99_012287 [Tenebrio molitor]